MITRYPLAVGIADLMSLGQELRSAADVDLTCFMGPWRVIACMDNAMEHEMVDATETYMLREDGSIEVHFRWREKSFTAEEKTFESVCQVAGGSTNAQWKAALFPLLSARFSILAVHPQYEWAAMAHPSRKFGWVLSRGRAMEARDYREALRVFEHQGFDIRSFIKIPQFARREKYSGSYLPQPSFKCA